jgi:hypothetical protein
LWSWKQVFKKNQEKICCEVVVTQSNYHSLNKQDSIKQARGRSHEEGLVQIFYAEWNAIRGDFEVI